MKTCSPRFVLARFSVLLLLSLGLGFAEPVQLRLEMPTVSVDAGGYADRCEVFVDGKNPFPPRTQPGERMQVPTNTIELAAGTHVLTPGNHEFTVNADGTVTTTATGLAAEGNRLTVTLVPLTLETRNAETGERRVPAVLKPILDAGVRVFERGWHFNPRYPTAATIYVPTGKFVLQPQGAELEVGPTSVTVQSDPTRTLAAEGLTVIVTMQPFRYTLQRHTHLGGRGIQITLQGNGLHEENSAIYQWWSSTMDYDWLLPAAPAPFVIHLSQSSHELGRIAPGTPLCPPLTIDQRAFPCQSLLVSRLDERSDGTYTFLAGIEKLKFQSGETLQLRHEFHQNGIEPPLKNPRLVVRLRPDRPDEEKWQTLPDARLPDDLPTDRYRLRLVMVGDGDDAEKSVVYREFSIGVVNPGQMASASLYLPAERWNYLAGEEIEAQGTLQVKAATTGKVFLRVRGERLDRMFEAGSAKKLDAGRHHQGWVLRSQLTGALKPGEYTFTVVFAGKEGQPLAESLPQRVTIISTIRPSLFPGVIDCYTDGWLYGWLNGTKEGARQVFGVGADMLRFDAYGQTLPGQPLAPMVSPREVLPGDPDLPPAEVTRTTYSAWRAFDEALAYRAAILPSLFMSDGPRIETKQQHILAEQRRFIRLHTQFWRRCPSFAGCSYGHWSGPSYLGGGGYGNNPPTPTDLKATQAAVWSDFCKEFGFTGDPPTTWNPISMPSGGAAMPANAKLWEKWVQYMNGLIPAVYRDWQRAATEICPTALNTDSRGAPGFGNMPRVAYDGYGYGNAYQNTEGLDIIEGVTNDDWGIEPYSLELMADLFDFGWRKGKPVWVGGWAQNGLSQVEYQREALQTLARGAIPALYGASLAPVFLSRANDDWMHQDWGRRQATERVFQSTGAYGEWAWRFQIDKPLAILVSYTQAALRDGRTGYAAISNHGATIYETYVACLLAGHSATFVYEDEIAADPKVLDQYKAVLMVNIGRPLPDNIEQALAAFAKNGGQVIDKFPTDFGEFLKYGWKDFGKENNSTEYTSGYWWHMRDVISKYRTELQAQLDKVVQPIVRTDQTGVLLTTARHGDAVLIYATNDKPLAYTNSTDMTRPFMYLHQCWNATDSVANVTIRADKGVLYDALRMREVPTEKTADGLRFTASFTDLSGTMYAFLPQRIEGVHLEAASKPGSITVRALASGSPVPMELVVTDSAGNERYRVYRVSGDAVELPVAANDAAGDWTITARELLSGKSFTAKLAVQPAAWPGGSTVRPPLIVTDKAPVSAFLKSKQPKTIALDRRQAALEPLAKRLARSLRAEVRWIDELPRGTVYPKLIWGIHPLPPSIAVKGSLILLGMPRDNMLLEELSEAGLLLRTAFADYPGGDGAIVTHVWSAFTGDDPVLAVMSATETGLRNAIDHLGTGYDPVPALESARAETLPPMFRKDGRDEARPPKLKPLAGTPGQSSNLVINPPGVAIRALAVSADGKTVRSGPTFTQHIEVTPDGQYTVTATTQPPAVFVTDAAGKELWRKTDIPYDWGTDPRYTRDEPDYFALSPSGDRVVVRQNPQRLVCYETATGKQLWERSYAATDARIWRDAHKLRFTTDRLIVSVTSYFTDYAASTNLANTATETLDAGLKALDTEARHPLLSLDPATGNIQWSRTERTIPVATGALRGHFFAQFTPRPDLDHRGLYFQQRRLGYYLSVSRDGARICASDDRGNHSIYGNDGTLLASYAIPGRPVLSPDGATLAIFQENVTLVNLSNGRQQLLTLAGEEEVSDVAWSADGQRLAVARWDGLVQTCDAAGKRLGTATQPPGVGAILLALPGGGWLAGTSHGELLRLAADGTSNEVKK